MDYFSITCADASHAFDLYSFYMVFSNVGLPLASFIHEFVFVFLAFNFLSINLNFNAAY
jgi:hypothetical protein